MSDAGFETILYDVDGGVCRVTLNRPEQRNGMTNRMVREARDALELAAADSSVRVLVLTGAGSSFCPGADLNHFTAGGADVQLTSREFAVTTLLHEIPAVTIAAINGACAGAGMGWAMACDLRVITASAKMNTAFLDVAVAGDMGLPWSLPRLIGAGRARELSFLPGRITANDALRLGLVSRVFPDETFRVDTEAIVATLMKKSPSALLGLKQNYIAAEQMDFRDFVQYEAERHLKIAASEDTREAFRAFVEKREPRFS
jgi:2-(1,2-epoxy-1,2-dihydrophenyl)acetyl-CoA isomerase